MLVEELTAQIYDLFEILIIANKVSMKKKITTCLACIQIRPRTQKLLAPEGGAGSPDLCQVLSTQDNPLQFDLSLTERIAS